MVSAANRRGEEENVKNISDDSESYFCNFLYHIVSLIPSLLLKIFFSELYSERGRGVNPLICCVTVWIDGRVSEVN